MSIMKATGARFSLENTAGAETTMKKYAACTE